MSAHDRLDGALDGVRPSLASHLDRGPETANQRPQRFELKLDRWFVSAHHFGSGVTLTAGDRQHTGAVALTIEEARLVAVGLLHLVGEGDDDFERRLAAALGQS